MKLIRYLLVAITAAVSATARGGEVIAGPEFALPFAASAAVRGPGEYLVVGTDGGAVRAARVGAGGELLGSPITVFNAGQNVWVSAAWNGDVYLVVWSLQFYSGPFQTSSFIQGVRLNAAGEVLDTEPIQIASAQTSEEGCSNADGGNFPFCRYLSGPVVTSNGSTFLVAWDSHRGMSKFDDVQGVQLGANGALQGGETTLVAYAGNTTLAATSNGTAYLLAYQWWVSHGTPTVIDVYVLPTDDGLLASADGSFSMGVNGPVVASDGSGFLVAWRAYMSPEGEGWLSLHVSSEGVRSARTLLWPGAGSAPALTFEGAQYLLLFGRPEAGASTLFALRLSREGVPLDPEPQSLAVSTLPGILASGGKGASLLVYGPHARLILTDSTPPVVNVPEAMAVTATSVSGAVVEFEATATDDYAGLLTPACSPASGTQFPPGATQVTCFARDEAGNVGTAAFPVRVAFAWSGVLQPMNPDGSSVFKLGRTVPVKFQLVGASANITNLAATLTVRKVADGVLGSVEEATSTSAADYGNHFRYDALGATYIFNLATGGLSAGTYEARIDMNDGIERVALFALRQ